MLRYGYLDNQQQVEEFTTHDAVESSRAVIKKAWMDTKRFYSPLQIAQATSRITRAIEEFQPDVILLGDDNAANYLGNQFIDTRIPVVFWGINGLPMKYGLLDSMEQPGHNVTGVWQSGYLKESLELLKQLVPHARTFAILASDSETSRPKIKEIMALDREGQLPLKLVDTVSTNAFATFQQRALALAEQVDAFFVLNHDTLKDAQGQYVDMLTAGKWYLEHIHKPETSHEDQFVREGMLCAANDSGYNQGHSAFEMAVEILDRGAHPAYMPPRTPRRGPFMVNRQRAQMLGIALEPGTGMIEEVVEAALALQSLPSQ
jgi:ABC-type uncharacterized transport system substrate-binding protein